MELKIKENSQLSREGKTLILPAFLRHGLSPKEELNPVIAAGLPIFCRLKEITIFEVLRPR